MIKILAITKMLLKHSRYNNISLPYNPTDKQGQEKLKKKNVNAK